MYEEIRRIRGGEKVAALPGADAEVKAAISAAATHDDHGTPSGNLHN